MFRSRIFSPLIKEAWHTFRSCATRLLLAIILARANAYSRALTTLRLSSTVVVILVCDCLIALFETAAICFLNANKNKMIKKTTKTVLALKLQAFKYIFLYEYEFPASSPLQSIQSQWSNDTSCHTHYYISTM